MLQLHYLRSALVVTLFGMSMSVTRKLAAIVSMDVVSYSRLIGVDEAGTLARMKAYRQELWNPEVDHFGGRIVGTAGDSLLVEFASAVAAVECAIAVQRGMAEREADEPEGRRMRLRIGVNVGEIVVDGDDILGEGVNVAARLEGAAPPGGIAISEDTMRQVEGKVNLEFTDTGLQQLKNIERPVRVFSSEPAGASADASATSPPAPSDRPSIAVLPFENMSGEADQEFFADGMAEDITTALSKLRWFFVIARNSTIAYKGGAPDVSKVTRELGVRYLLEGSVRTAGERVRISAQLVDGESGAHVWAERYDRQVTDIFAVQDEITRNVVRAIEPQLYAAENLRIRSTPPESLDAWGCVIRSLWHLGRFTGEDTEEACRLLSKAVAMSPDYARAHSMLAFATSRRLFFGADMNAAVAEAGSIAETARALDDDDPWSHFAAGYVECFTGRYDNAIAWYRRAIELNENFALAHGNMAAALAFGGYPEEAVEAVERAVRMSPRDPFNYSYLHFAGVAYFAAGRYAEGVESERHALRERSNFTAALRCLAACYAALGEPDRAREVIAEVLRLDPDSSVSRDAYGQVAYARDADRERFASALRDAGLPV